MLTNFMKYIIDKFCTVRSRGLFPKELYTSVAVPSVLVQFLTNDHFLGVSHQSLLSNDDVDNKGAVHRSHRIYFTAEETRGRPLLGDQC